MIEMKWFWRHWKTWDFVCVTYEGGGGVYVVYIGCLVIGWHYG